MKLKIASAMFPISFNLRQNLNFMLKHMKRAAAKKADIIHFSECCLSGYAGCGGAYDQNYSWQELYELSTQLCHWAKKLNIWVVFGSSHRFAKNKKPFNSLFVVNNRGKLVTRYDKRFCTGDPKGIAGDLGHYSPGSFFATFTIKGVICGLLICHDFRYQELYREYKKLNATVMFHSFYNGGQTKNDMKKFNIWGKIVPPTLQAYAANNYMWISSANCGGSFSRWANFFVRPDGIIVETARNTKNSLTFSTIDTKLKLYDASLYWRDRAMNGIYHSGNAVKENTSRTKFSNVF